MILFYHCWGYYGGVISGCADWWLLLIVHLSEGWVCLADCGPVQLIVGLSSWLWACPVHCGPVS